MGHEGQQGQYHPTCEDKDKGLIGEGREHEAKGNDGSKVVDEAGTQNSFAKLGFVKTGLQHHGVHYRHGSRGKGNSTEQARLIAPSEQVTCGGRAAEKRCEETHQPDDGYLLYLRAERVRVELGAGEERQEDRSGGGEET